MQSGTCLVGKRVKNQRRLWFAGAALLTTVGTAGSVLGAAAVARNDAQDSREAMITSSVEIASTLKLAIQQEDSLAISAQAYVVANPNASNTDFLSWVRTMHVAKRFPEVRGLGFIAVVRPGQLPQFVARILADPPKPLAAGQSYEIIPPGDPTLLLPRGTYSDGNGGVSLPVGYDVCTSYNSAQLAKLFAGSNYLPYRVKKKDYFVLEAPVYPGGTIPASAKARSESVLGLVGMVTLPSFDLRASSQGPPGNRRGLPLRIRLIHGSLQGWLGAGGVEVEPQSIFTTDGTWRPSQGWMAPDCSRTQTRSSSCWREWCSACCWEPLSTCWVPSRLRALALVDERTGELHHLALHDPLTELPIAP